MILTMGLLALDLDEQDAEQAAGGLVGFYDEDRSSHLLLRAVVVYEVISFRPIQAENPLAYRSVCVDLH